MKQLSGDLRALSRALNQLERQIEKIAKRLDKVEKAKPARKPKMKPAAKAKTPKKRMAIKAEKPAAIGTILDIITRAGKGVETETLKRETGFENQKIWNAINRLKTQGKVKSAKRGIYVKV